MHKRKLLYTAGLTYAYLHAPTHDLLLAERKLRIAYGPWYLRASVVGRIDVRGVKVYRAKQVELLK